MQMNDDGEIAILYSYGTRAGVDDTGTEQDVCNAVAYDDSRKEIVFLIEATSATLRPNL